MESQDFLRDHRYWSRTHVLYLHTTSFRTAATSRGTSNHTLEQEKGRLQHGIYLNKLVLKCYTQFLFKMKCTLFHWISSWRFEQKIHGGSCSSSKSKVSFHLNSRCVCVAEVELQELMIAFIRNFTQGNENSVFSAPNHFDHIRLSVRDHHVFLSISMFHYTEHALICGSRDEAADPDDINSARHLFHILWKLKLITWHHCYHYCVSDCGADSSYKVFSELPGISSKDH